MIKRIIPITNKSYFLFGPRGTGKSTWLKKQVAVDFYIDLLQAKDIQRFSTDLSLLRQIIEGNSNYRTIVIDEIQKLPELLDEIHSLIFEHEDKVQFILTGSSARKLKKGGVNLLAGRALIRHFHSYSAMELGNAFNIETCLKFGMLPKVWSFKTMDEKVDYLYSYVASYLKEEIQQEAAVRSLPSYLKFLEHFALRNAQIINLQNLSGEIGIPRSTINGYLDILEQTLLGSRLEPIHLKAKVKEVSTPKFYFFDTGVVRTLTKKVEEDLGEDKGALLETYILHEIKTYSDYFLKRYEVYYWGTPSENEVDFIVCKGTMHIGIEVKSSKTWKKDFNIGLQTLLAEKKILKAYGVYLGNEILKNDHITIYPIKIFLMKLHENQLF